MTRCSFGLLVSVVALGAWACGNSSSTGGGTSGHGGSSFVGSAGRGGGPTGAGGSTMSGTSGYTGGTGTGGAGTNTGTGGGSNPAGCVPGQTGLQLIDCGYPMMGATGLAAVVFNESTVLEAVVPTGGEPTATIQVFYNDEHAMTLGVRQVQVKSGAGTTMMDFPVSPLPSDPGSVTNPMLGTTMITGDYSGLDVSLRPMWPSLFVTDTTTNPNSRAGDWQSGGVPVGPQAVFGSWKGALRVVDKTVNPPTASITPDMDPMMNNWNLGTGADPVPMGLMDLGFGAEARFVVPLTKGHTYRLQVMVHDGDQRKVGGDSGEACILFCAGTSSGGGGGGAGGSAPPPMCPAGSMSCGGGIDPLPCPAQEVCVSGCCISSIIIP